ncbi:MAG: hypothetical protein KJ017_00200 [Alphaproteobacteria bacterium]|nr:hypothetical protein [Alphaproteobacteria bacterium]
MTKLELGALISRVFALFFLVTSANMFVLIWPQLFALDEQGIKIITVLLAHFSFWALLSAFFWFFSRTIGGLLAGPSSTNDSVPSIQPDAFMVGIFAGFGCYLIGQSIPDLADLASELVYMWTTDTPSRRPGLAVVGANLRILINLVMAMFFIFGARGLQKFVFSLRGIPREK